MPNMTDQDICNLLKVPQDRRAELLNRLHSWAMDYLPGPGLYATKAVLIWKLMQSPHWASESVMKKSPPL